MAGEEKASFDPLALAVASDPDQGDDWDGTLGNPRFACGIVNGLVHTP